MIDVSRNHNLSKSLDGPMPLKMCLSACVKVWTNWRAACSLNRDSGSPSRFQAEDRQEGNETTNYRTASVMTWEAVSIFFET